MRISVVSDSFELPAALAQRSDINWSRTSSAGPIPAADLYIWDYGAGLNVRQHVSARENAQHLVVMDQKYMEGFSSFQNNVCILLKPVNPFTVKTCVELALRTWE